MASLTDQPTVTEYEADGVAVMRIEFGQAGILGPQHAHSYPHLTMLERGAVRVFRDGAAPREVFAPDAIVIPAVTRHLFETLTDSVVLLCVHNTSRAGQVEVASEHQIVEAS